LSDQNHLLDQDFTESRLGESNSGPTQYEHLSAVHRAPWESKTEFSTDIQMVFD